MISLLTVIPVGRRPIALAPRQVGPAIALAPLIGVLVWLPAAGVQIAVRVLLHNPPNLVAPTLALATVALMTGGLHLDGLADFADGLGSRRPPAEALAIMKDSAIGAIGAVTLIFVLIVQGASLQLAIGRHHGTVALLTAVLAGRLAVVHACRTGIPAARTDGLGISVIGSVSAARSAIVTALVFVVAAVAGKLDIDGGRLRESVHATFAVFCAVIVAALLRRLAVRRLGGMTGDVFGALIEVAVVVDLFVMAIPAPSWLH
ncbi:MAG TPA: adenosylcobinamide-GDP ribazoletransferase [Frankiaceae bacterium]|nr:adenosylcobinamide-GDP ribazoletransferase [Frankiaceae bacterium]